jgi:hypothetical protein
MLQSISFGDSSRAHTRIPLRDIYPTSRASSREAGWAVANYRSRREIGESIDSPPWEFPCDGDYAWHETLMGKQPTYRVRYTEGPKDREWMEARDRNFFARQAAEKQCSDREVTKKRKRESPPLETQVQRRQSVLPTVNTGDGYHLQSQVPSTLPAPVYTTPWGANAVGSMGVFSADAMDIAESVPSATESGCLNNLGR